MTTHAAAAGPFISTFTGRLVNPLRLQAEDLAIEDIAHGLACMNRFCGHAKQPLNVAWHSVWVSRLCAPEDALQGLLHDASEAYLGDVTKWLKKSPEFAAYRAAEDRVQETIYAAFGCPLTMTESVRRADTLMVRVEGWWSWGEYWPGALFAPVEYAAPTPQELERVWGWGPPAEWASSRDAFLRRYQELQR